MKRETTVFMQRRKFIIAGGISLGTAIVATMQARAANAIPTLTFMTKRFVLSAVQAQNTVFIFLLQDQQEQPDSNKVNEAFSVLCFNDVSGYDQLRAKKELIAKRYKKPGSVIFTDKEAPPSAEFRGECFLVTGQGGPSDTDINFSRFVLADGTGFCLLYTKSFHDYSGQSQDSATRAGAWVNSLGNNVSGALIDFSITLNHGILNEWAASGPSSGAK
jgi:hypothetical protein